MGVAGPGLVRSPAGVYSVLGSPAAGCGTGAPGSPGIGIIDDTAPGGSAGVILHAPSAGSGTGLPGICVAGRFAPAVCLAQRSPPMFITVSSDYPAAASPASAIAAFARRLRRVSAHLYQAIWSTELIPAVISSPSPAAPRRATASTARIIS